MSVTLQGFSQTDWARAANTTLVKYFTDVEQTVLRNFAMGALLESQGRVTYNNGGRGWMWPIQYRLHDMTGNSGETPRNFTRTNLWKWANLEARGYQITDAITYKEYTENKSEQGIIKVFDGLTERMQQSMRQRLGPEYFVDGSAAGHETDWHGLESMYGVNGTVNSTDGTQRAANAADFVGYPSDTYAGISTVLGNYGGANETGEVWPLGIADPEFDFYSPLVVNYTCTGFGGTSKTWAKQGDEALRYGLIHAQRNTNQAGQISTVFLNRSMFYDFKNLLDDKEQIQVNRNQPDGLVALGFRNTINFDGAEITYENAVPSKVGYGIPIQAVELCSEDATLLRVEGPEWDMRQQSWIAAVSTLSNLKFMSPRNFVKWAQLA
jgi:hypothetical protein